MTAATNPADQQPGNAQASLSGMPDAPELLKIRIQPAQFARALGVSKQSVSRWVRDGWITLSADGRLDPTVAIGQLLRRCDPGRLRARWLRQAIGEVQDLRDNLAIAEDRAEAGEAALTDARKRIAYLESFIADLDCMFDAVLRLFVVREAELRATATSEEWAGAVSSIESAAADTCSAAQPDPADTLDVGPLDLDLDATLAADWAAFNARLHPPRRESSDTAGERGE
ncbi:MAG TPA: hypothetical protein VMV78_07850 [Thiobacillus sp.]|nr:hypothetical protein [Thiobacillus sp.]